MAIKLEGADNVLSALNKIANTERLNTALGKCCALVELTAKKKAPKDTGELRRSITSKVEDNQGIVFTTLEYAPYIEYGTGLFAENGGRKDVPWNYKDDKGEWHSTSGMKPQPYMRPALDESRTKIIEALKEGIG